MLRVKRVKIKNESLPNVLMREVHNLFLAASSEQNNEEIQQKNSWFKDAFLDCKRNLKEEIHEELKRQVPFRSGFDQF